MEAKLNKLKVTDLRDELTKRGLSKTGLKAELVKRLAEAMKSEDKENVENNHSDDEKPEKRTTRITKKAAPKKKVESSSDEESEEEKPVVRKGKTAAKTKKVSSDEEESESEEEKKPVRKTAAKAPVRGGRKVVKKVESSSEESSSESDSEKSDKEEEAPKKKAPVEEKKSAKSDEKRSVAEKSKEKPVAPVEEPKEKPVEAPKAPVVEAPKVVEVPKVVEAPKVVEKVVETPKPVEAPKVVEKPTPMVVEKPVEKEIEPKKAPVETAIETPQVAPKIVEAPKVVEKPTPMVVEKPVEKEAEPPKRTVVAEPKKVEAEPPKASEPVEVQVQPTPTARTPSRDSTRVSRVSSIFRSINDLAKYVNQVVFERDIKVVAEQVSPGLKPATSAIKLLKNYNLFIVDKILKESVVPGENTYRRVITNESLIKGIQKVYTQDIAKHAMPEIEKAAERFKTSSIENAGLVYDVKLFESLIINGRFISDPKSLPAEVTVMLSAALEYFTAEVIELTKTATVGKRELNMTATHIRQAIPKDEEIASVLKGYSCPHENDDQRYASQNWKSKLNELLELLGKLPSEELGEAIQEANQKLTVVDTKNAALEILEAYSQEVSSEELSVEIKRLASMLTIHDSQLKEHDFASINSSYAYPYNKETIFSLTVPNTSDKLTFFYSSQSWDIYTSAHTEMSVTGAIEGVLWTNYVYYQEQRNLNHALLHDILEMLNVSEAVGIREFVRILLSIGEASSGGGFAVVDDEMEEFEMNNAFVEGVPHSPLGHSDEEMEDDVIME